MSDDSTQSLCPVCLERIPARRVARGADAFLEKRCSAHGAFQTPIWKGAPEMNAWYRPKIATQPAVVGHDVDRGCPFDCGLCPDHRQRSCTVILEVTQRCDLGCRFCYADARPRGNDPSVAAIAGWFERLRRSSQGANIQLSGGEPTLRDDLPALVALGRQAGFAFIQINTNGLRLAREPGYAQALRAAGAASVFLQFDGVDDTIHRALRGRALWAAKQAAVAACAQAGLGVVLVPTLVPGINTHAVGAILDMALGWYPTVRGVHFQPVSYFGRHPGPPSDGQRLTLPELMRAIESQTGGRFQADHFRPPGCEHALCSFHAQYLLSPDGRPRPLHPLPMTPMERAPIRAEEGAARAIGAVARQWAGPAPQVSAARCCGGSAAKTGSSQPMALDDFLEAAQSRTFSVSAMAFQDVWNLDLERVQGCCIHVMAPDGRLIPFCLYNLTAADGRALYRL
jgi:hypothetical protein